MIHRAQKHDKCLNLAYIIKIVFLNQIVIFFVLFWNKPFWTGSTGYSSP
jgi:hypothetical protein